MKTAIIVDLPEGSSVVEQLQILELALNTRRELISDAVKTGKKHIVQIIGGENLLDLRNALSHTSITGEVITIINNLNNLIGNIGKIGPMPWQHKFWWLFNQPKNDNLLDRETLSKLAKMGDIPKAHCTALGIGFLPELCEYALEIATKERKF